MKKRLSILTAAVTTACIMSATVTAFAEDFQRPDFSNMAIAKVTSIDQNSVTATLAQMPERPELTEEQLAERPKRPDISELTEEQLAERPKRPDISELTEEQLAERPKRPDISELTEEQLAQMPERPIMQQSENSDGSEPKRRGGMRGCAEIDFDGEEIIIDASEVDINIISREGSEQGDITNLSEGDIISIKYNDDGDTIQSINIREFKLEKPLQKSDEEE